MLILRRYVWEIILGAHNAFAKEESLVTIDLENGVDCDVIGDVHGEHSLHRSKALCASSRFC